MRREDLEMDKKISVIIPIYNAEKYLKQTLDCVCSQTYQNLEIVCVLDCPTDHSEKIVEEFAKNDNRIFIIKLPQNSGPSTARNTGIEKSVGEYIHFMDSDDIINPGFYENLLATATNENVDVTVCNFFYEKSPHESVYFQGDKIVQENAKFEETEVLTHGFPFRYLIKRDFWLKHNLLFPPDLSLMEDRPVMVGMIYYANTVALCSNATYFHKNNENSIANKTALNEEAQKRRNRDMNRSKEMVNDFLLTHKIIQPNKKRHSDKIQSIRINNRAMGGNINKKISVVVPIYNVEKYLKETLNSIRLQSYQNLEIICVLDCPTDNSAKIVKEIAKEDNRIKLVEHSKNMGLPAARNSGVENASSEYIHFMDSDDLISPDFYKTMISAAINNDADVVACSVFYEKKPKQSILFSPDEIVFSASKIEKTKITFAGWAWRYLIKKSFWSKHNFSFPDLVPLEDMPVMIQMIYYANKVVLCSNAAYFYKNRENSILNYKKKYDIEQVKLLKENFKKAEKIYVDFLRANKIKRPRWLYRRYLSFRTKRPICVNKPIEYGKIDKKISVIIPIYNAENYLNQTLDSVRFQTYKNLEIICVLDCSLDNSAEITKKIAKEDSRIKLVEHSKNMGLPSARNSGVKNATGEYIHFIDADDLLSPDFYEIMISAAENAEADVAACSVFYEKKPKRSIWFQNSEVLSNTDDKIKKTKVAIQGWAWRYLIKKSFWNEHHFSFPELVPMEDMPVMIPMIYYANKVVLCPCAVYFYKNRESSILNRKYDAEREKQRSENRRKARKIFKEFMRTHKIKRPNRLLYYIKRFFA